MARKRPKKKVKKPTAKELAALGKRLDSFVGKAVSAYVMEHLDPSNITPKSLEKLITEGKQIQRELASIRSVEISRRMIGSMPVVKPEPKHIKSKQVGKEIPNAWPGVVNGKFVATYVLPQRRRREILGHIRSLRTRNLR